MNIIPHDSLLAQTLIDAIRNGKTTILATVLEENPSLASSFIQDSKKNSRSLLHIATDWPGHFPQVNETIRLLIAAGANVNAVFIGPNSETPLHWAASSNDVSAIDALLEGGADLDAQGAVIAGGDPLEDAIGFQNWKAAERLVERGAKTKLGDEAALGLIGRIKNRFSEAPAPSQENIDYSFWNACCAGQLEAAEFLLATGADINWKPGWCEESPLDGAQKNGNAELIKWLESNGAVRRTESQG